MSVRGTSVPAPSLATSAEATAASSIPDSADAVGWFISPDGTVPEAIGLARNRLTAFGFTGAVGAMIPLSVAVDRSGAAEAIAGGLVDVVGDAGPHALLLGLFVITAVFGQLISNTATALIIIPIAISAAADLGISVRPVMMSLTVAAAGAFLTPIATAANLMVMEPSGYRFGDYWKFGLVNLLLFAAGSVVLVPVFWPF